MTKDWYLHAVDAAVQPSSSTCSGLYGYSFNSISGKKSLFAAAIALSVFWKCDEGALSNPKIWILDFTPDSTYRRTTRTQISSMAQKYWGSPPASKARGSTPLLRSLTSRVQCIQFVKPLSRFKIHQLWREKFLDRRNSTISRCSLQRHHSIIVLCVYIGAHFEKDF